MLLCLSFASKGQDIYTISSSRVPDVGVVIPPGAIVVAVGTLVVKETFVQVVDTLSR